MGGVGASPKRVQHVLGTLGDVAPLAPASVEGGAPPLENVLNTFWVNDAADQGRHAGVTEHSLHDGTHQVHR